jgi:polyferredoxin
MTLRKIRIGIAVIVFGLFLFIFIGNSGFVQKLALPLLAIQFGPSLLKFFYTVAGITSAGFLLVLILTLIFGRFYCAALCPLGILQDVVFHFNKKRNRKHRSYQKSYIRLRYIVLVITIISSLLGSFILLNFLEPYSLFGRFGSYLFRPLMFFLNNKVSTLLQHFEIYAVPIRIYPYASWFAFGLVVLVFGGLAIAAWLRGRLYCNTLCPVGTLLGLCSCISVFRIKIEQSDCTSCRLCERICRSGCIDVPNLIIDQSRCVACFDCIDVCPTAAVKYQYAFKNLKEQRFSPERRELFRGVLGVGLISAALPAGNITRKWISRGQTPITPPGSINRRHFTETCTACQLCVSACPSHVITPSLFSYGIAGMLQPRMNFHKGYCEYECNLCGQVCPTGAIRPLVLDQKKLTKIGEVCLIKRYCVVYCKQQDCGACAEVCPTHAVYTVERRGLFFPETNPALCIGCGACEMVCPALPKAIVVEALAVHTRAQQPFSELESPENPKTAEKGDFPF